MWLGWPLARLALLIVGALFMAIFAQVTLFHLRQNFREPAMWAPVIATPVLGIVALVLTWAPSAVLASVFTGLLIVGAIIGLVGTYYHVAGVRKRVGGYNLNNFMVGPPPLLPLAVTLVSLFGMAAVPAVAKLRY